MKLILKSIALLVICLYYIGLNSTQAQCNNNLACIRAQQAIGVTAKTSNPRSEELLKILSEKTTISVKQSKDKRTATVYVIDLSSDKVIHKSIYHLQTSGLYTSNTKIQNEKALAGDMGKIASDLPKMAAYVFPQLEFEVNP